MESFVEYCKDYIVDTLPEYEGNRTYGADLCSLIMEGPNADGSLTYSTQKAIDYIEEWWDDCAEFWDFAKLNFGKDYVADNLNVFDNPESFMVAMVYEGIEYIFGRVSVIDEFWDNELELTEEIIDSIIAEVENIDEIEW